MAHMHLSQVIDIACACHANCKAKKHVTEAKEVLATLAKERKFILSAVDISECHDIMETVEENDIQTP